MGYVNPRTNSIVAHLPEVKAQLDITQHKASSIAEGLFAMHDHGGGAEITTSKGQLDRYVNLVDTDGGKGEPAAAAIEFGHTTPDGKPIEGLHILRRTLGMI